MTFKSILAPLQFEETAKPTMESAMKVAQEFDAHIHAKHVRPPYVAYAPYAYHTISMTAAPVAVAEQFEVETSKNAAKLKAIFETCCEREGIKATPFSEACAKPKKTACWSDTTGSAIQSMAHFARVCDLSVFTRPDQSGIPRDIPVFEGLLMSSGRPVLTVPPEGLAKIPENVLVAWDGSLPATRAMHAAMPFLKKAEQVIVVTVGEVDFGMPSAHSAAQYLMSHGINAAARTIDWPKSPIAERLLNQAEATNSDLIVMGGYSHARLFETLLGGTTRHMLSHSDRALFLAH